LVFFGNSPPVRRLYAERTELNDEILNCVDTEDFDGTVTAEGSDATRTMVRRSPRPSPLRKTHGQLDDLELLLL